MLMIGPLSAVAACILCFVLHEDFLGSATMRTKVTLSSILTSTAITVAICTHRVREGNAFMWWLASSGFASGWISGFLFTTFTTSLPKKIMLLLVAIPLGVIGYYAAAQLP